MRNAALACFLILIPCALRAQDKQGDWKALYSLHSGEKIELIETSMKKHVGTFSTVTEEAIQLREGSKRNRHSQRKRRARDAARKKPSVAATLLSLASSARERALELARRPPRCSNSNTSFNLCGIGRGAEIAVGAVVGLVGGAGIGGANPVIPQSIERSRRNRAKQIMQTSQHIRRWRGMEMTQNHGLPTLAVR